MSYSFRKMITEQKYTEGAPVSEGPNIPNGGDSQIHGLVPQPFCFLLHSLSPPIYLLLFLVTFPSPFLQFFPFPSFFPSSLLPTFSPSLSWESGMRGSEKSYGLALRL